MAKGFLIQRDLTKGKVFPNLILFALPFFLSYFLNSLYSAIDLIFIGNFSTVSDVAAVSSGTTVIFAVNSIIMGIATGGTIIIGQYFGAKLKDGISNAIRNTIIIMGLLGIGTTLLMLALSYPIIELMQVEGNAKNIAQNYLLILSSGIILYVGYITIAAILRGIGNSFAGFIFSGVAALSNILFDFLFVKVWDLGALGAATATVIGEAIALISAISYILIRKIPYRITLKGWLNREYVLPILKSGIPVALQDGLVVISFAIVIAALSTRGETYTAAVGVTDRITSFGFVPLSAIGAAVSTATAQCMGAKDVDRVKVYLRDGLILGSVASLVFGSLCMFIPRQLATIFAAHEEETIELATWYIQATGLDLFVCGLIFPLNAVFVGSGHSVFAMSHNLGSTFLVRVPYALITCLAINTPMFVVGLCYPISSIVSLTLCLIFYLTGKWVKMDKLEGEEING